MGDLPGEYHIVTDDTVPPVVHPPRRVPVALRDQIKEKLDEMVTSGIRAPVSEPTEWVSSMLVIVKPNKLRICLDPLDLNKAIRREHYQMPTVKEVATRLSQTKKFTVVDSKDGFWQKRLDTESSYKTTFNTPMGRYRWKRMPFGISSAPEVWKSTMHEFVEDLEGVEMIADDFLIAGFGNTGHEVSQFGFFVFFGAGLTCPYEGAGAPQAVHHGTLDLATLLAHLAHHNMAEQHGGTSSCQASLV